MGVKQAFWLIMKTRWFTFTGSHILGSFGGRMISAGAHIGGDTGATLAWDRREEGNNILWKQLVFELILHCVHSICTVSSIGQLVCSFTEGWGATVPTVSQYYNRCNKSTIGHFCLITHSLAEPLLSKETPLVPNPKWGLRFSWLKISRGTHYSVLIRNALKLSKTLWFMSSCQDNIRDWNNRWKKLL